MGALAEQRVRDRLRRVAADTFGWAELRPEQLAAMEQVATGGDVLAVLPTGAGKSAIYQVPALLLDGPTVVVSPLIALQHDQREGLAESDAPEAVAVNSAQRGAHTDDAWTAVREGSAEYLFLAPEQLAKQEVVAELQQAGVSLIVIDEAHCVSAWGHDFRPDYLRLGQVIERLGHPPVAALTATAAPPVRADIADRLGLRDHREVVAGFDRPNLHLTVRQFADDAARRAEVVSRVLDATPPGLVYAATRKDTETYTDELARHGLRVAGYHAGRGQADRDDVHQRFLSGDLDVVVATSAFGMGIDKPDVRFVVHAAAPDSVDSYYQEIGRAGRDDRRAAVELLYHPKDLSLQRFLTARRPMPDTLTAVATVLAHRTYLAGIRELAKELDLPVTRVTRAVNLLEQAGAVSTTRDGRIDYLHAHLSPAAAADQALAAGERYQELVRSRIEMMRGYAETPGCRRQYLLGYFGDHLDEPCGDCDTCDAGTDRIRAETAAPNGSGADPEPEFTPDMRVRHVEWGQGVVLSTETDRLTVLFDRCGYKTLALAAVQDNHLLIAEGLAAPTRPPLRP